MSFGRNLKLDPVRIGYPGTEGTNLETKEMQKKIRSHLGLIKWKVY